MTFRRASAEAGAALAALILLLGCADTSRTYNFQQYHDRWPELISWHSTKPIEIAVWGNPFDATQSSLEAAVAESFSKLALRPGSLMPVRTGGPLPSAAYIAVVFDAAPRPFGFACRDLSNVRLEQPTRGRVDVSAAICRGGAPLTRIQGSASGVTGTSDPKLGALLDRMAVRLFRMPPAR